MASNKFVLKIPVLGLESSASLIIKDGKKPFRIDLKASKNDIKNGVFGFDTIPKKYKEICESDISALKAEYHPLEKEVLEEEYLPSWLSIRKDQTVSLKLDWEKEKRAEFYNTIAFEEHADFEITPTNLKDADEVQIKCKNTSQNAAHLLIKADDLVVGGLNVFYPEPKSIDLHWAFVEISGDKKDYEKLKKELKINTLEALLKKALSPALIDIKIENNIPSTLDLSGFKDVFKNTGVIVKTPSYHYIEKDKKSQFVNYVMNEFKGDNAILNLFLVNRACMVSGATGEDGGSFELVAGFSPTGTGFSYGILNEKSDLLPTAIAHEIMHSLGLHHTFETKSKHTFKDKSTKNYMDYNATKEYTWKWQWQQLHQYRHLK